MNRLHQLNQDNLVATNKEYQNRTYNDLSSEFQKVHPSAVRAFQLIALTYNRLTLVEKLDHKSTVAKIYSDHKHLAGFSQRNIRRNLPLDNPSVPRRIRPSWPKSNFNETNEQSKLSNAKQQQQKVPQSPLNCDMDAGNNNATVATDIVKPTDCNHYEQLKLENCEIREALEKASTLITADKISSAEYSQNKDLQADILDFEFNLTKQQILDHLEQPYLSLKDGNLKIWFSGKIEKKSGRVISAKPGRIIEHELRGNDPSD
jgi:hypothetical protein